MTDRQQYLHNEDLFYKRAFERNIGILTEAEQDKLRQAPQPTTEWKACIS